MHSMQRKQGGRDEMEQEQEARGSLGRRSPKYVVIRYTTTYDDYDDYSTR